MIISNQVRAKEEGNIFSLILTYVKYNILCLDKIRSKNSITMINNIK